ncbi:MAG: hypothetical protein SF052_18295 [Bacteroidia bacterium]|nr:hypothetical protein [Bacteroidia bacterium]
MQKYSLVISVCFLLLTGFFVRVSAQSDPRIENKMAGMHEIFELTDEQSEQIRAVFTTTAAHLDKIRPLKKTDPASFRQQRQQIMRKMDMGIVAALDESQAAQFRQMQAEYRAQRQNGGTAKRASSGEVAGEVPTEEVNEVEISTENVEEISAQTEENEVIVEENTENATKATSKNEWLEKTLDFLYEDILMPAIRKNE